MCHSLDAEGFLLTVTKRNASGRRLARYELERKYPRSGWIFRDVSIQPVGQFRRRKESSPLLSSFRFRSVEEADETDEKAGEKYNDPRHGVLLILPEERTFSRNVKEIKRVA